MTTLKDRIAGRVKHVIQNQDHADPFNAEDELNWLNF